MFVVIPFEEFLNEVIVSCRDDLEQIVREIEQRIAEMNPDELRSRIPSDLQKLYSKCVEENSTLNCLWLITSLYHKLTGKSLHYSVIVVEVVKLLRNIYEIFAYLDIGDAPLPLLHTFVLARREVTRKDIVEFVVEELTKKTRDRYYTIDDLKPLVQRLFDVLSRKCLS